MRTKLISCGIRFVRDVYIRRSRRGASRCIPRERTAIPHFARQLYQFLFYRSVTMLTVSSVLQRRSSFLAKEELETSSQSFSFFPSRHALPFVSGWSKASKVQESKPAARHNVASKSFSAALTTRRDVTTALHRHHRRHCHSRRYRHWSRVSCFYLTLPFVQYTRAYIPRHGRRSHWIPACNFSCGALKYVLEQSTYST